MDMKTGKIYASIDDAWKDGVPVSDLAELQCPIDHIEQRLREGKPVVKFSGGSFKSFRRDESGQLVRA